MKFQDLPSAHAIEVTAFRNIYTSKTSQNLFDDLISPDHFPILQAWENATSQIDHSATPIERIFQYGDCRHTIYVFDEVNWRPGRFSNGAFGVWYGALDKETSVLETLYWSYRFAREDIATSSRPVTIDRKMFEAECKTNLAIELTTTPKEMQKRLVEGDDYSFCRKLGELAIQNKIGLFLTPSARRPGGVCVPVFQPAVIQRDRMLYFFHFTFFPDGQTQITTDEDRNIDIPESWKIR